MELRDRRNAWTWVAVAAGASMVVCFVAILVVERSQLTSAPLQHKTTIVLLVSALVLSFVAVLLALWRAWRE